ncbi:MAG: M28 family peptidase [Cyclobacteriaceae bacterium]|jgi:hypothetical protein|nr:M28 family peptidase [Cyclobacteriaceae bacterium]
MFRQIITILLLALSLQAFAQRDPVVDKYATTITSADLKANLSIIASDAMEGRETGKRGQKMAAAFISFTFQELGLTAPVNGGYYQSVPLYSLGAPDVSLKLGNTVIGADDFAFSGAVETNGEVTMPLIFVGKGSKEEIEKVQVADKAAVLILEGNASMNNNPAIVLLREKGAKAIFTVLPQEEDFLRMVARAKNFSGGRLMLTKPSPQTATAGIFFVSYNTVAKAFNTTVVKLDKAIADKKIDKIKPATAAFSIKQQIAEVKSENVLGYLEGTDKKDEVVVITAHYDHIGISPRAEGDKINNGADDDGSGTVAVLAMAKAFVQAKKEGKGPRRSILFMTVTGEEKGLLGSQFYTDNPVYSLDNTVVNLNIDMIGRSDPQHKTSAPYVYVIGSDKLSSELHTLSENVNKTYHNLVFDYTYNDQNHPDRLYYRSDHWNFAKKNIPIIFYFDGIHEDYHKVSDEVDKIEFDLLTKRTQTVFYTAWEIANRANRVAVDKK